MVAPPSMFPAQWSLKRGDSCAPDDMQDAVSNAEVYPSALSSKQASILSPKAPQQSPKGAHPSPKGSPQIRAHKTAGAAEAGQHDAEDLRVASSLGSRFNRVFGNGLFEGTAGEDTPPPPGNQGVPVRMNNLFTEPAAQSHSQLNADDIPDRGPGLAARRNASVTTPNTGRPHESGTLVQSFHDEEPVVAVRTPAPRAGPVSTIEQRNVGIYEAELLQLIAAGRREEAARRPGPSGAMVRCYIKRVQSLFGMHSMFQMHMDSGDVFLLAARRRKKSKVSSYVVSLDLDDLHRDTNNCMAKLKANFVGTEYIMWGRNGEGTHSDKKGYAREDMCIKFKQTALTIKGGPRAMYLALPLPDMVEAGQGGSDSLSEALDAAKRRDLAPNLERKLALLATKAPEYDPVLKAYILEFQGRVKEASVKNFQLVAWDHNTDCTGGDVLLQFGKVEKETYALDFSYPLNAELAFAVALASIDTKLCYTL
eukprot:CAMPEP_0119106018 /NCGR_PEP_ID=MMETSP1180-20130426/3825_1 /TAXON_ID=3052 ORGANISM="Chlamydomonas cf sp, Strain CCMP681" /NCGR_SAMPLE_ID=MMETSP1180 /ASSEMBLY_ACC=CAM_ASM_000741 /LENGTH=479 /DNA_ID=CAMNT_0007091235 /DNA_START=42 /DNA_END=1481 /DNA_ORIENTATION=+